MHDWAGELARIRGPGCFCHHSVHLTHEDGRDVEPLLEGAESPVR
jgi:hypothetical protein